MQLNDSAPSLGWFLEDSRVWPTYTLYGLSLASDFAFANRLGTAVAPANLIFTCVSLPPLSEDWQQTAPAYASPDKLESGESLIYIYQRPRYDVFRISEVADFYLWDDAIVCHLIDPEYHFAVEIWLLGTIFSYWLERRGIPALHASAVVVEDRAAVFLSTNKGGKTSLAASLMGLGYPLLTDDILPLEYAGASFRGRPGYPQMRMWPDQAEHFLGYYECLEQVHPRLAKRRIPVGRDGLGSFCNTAQPLACLYLPDRREEGEIKISPLRLMDMLTTLLQHSFLLGMVEALGLQESRFNLFAQLVQQVPVRRLTYPTGVEHLPLVSQAILDDLAILQPSV